MDQGGRMPDGQDPGYLLFQEQCRAKVTKYVLSIEDRGYPVTNTLSAVAAHQSEQGEADTCAAKVDAEAMAALSFEDRRTLVAMVATCHAIGNWSANEVGEIADRDRAYIPGVAVARMMMPAPFIPLDTALITRLTETFTVEEVSWLVCMCASIMTAMGFNPDMTRELDPQWTVDTP